MTSPSGSVVEIVEVESVKVYEYSNSSMIVPVISFIYFNNLSDGPAWTGDLTDDEYNQRTDIHFNHEPTLPCVQEEKIQEIT